MSMLDKLKGKSAQWSPVEGVEIQIPALSVGDGLDDLMTMQMSDNPEEIARCAGGIITKTLKKALPDATQEEIDDIGLEHLTGLMNVIMKVNNLEADESGDKMKKLQSMQEAYKARRAKK